MLQKMGIKTMLSALLAAALMAGCAAGEGMEPANSVYYWRTELRLDSMESAFLKDYDIRKFYCRYFDVVMSDGAKKGPVPNATITFPAPDDLPQGVELVPTVYITEDCMHQPHEELAGRLVQRIVQMNETNGISGVRELQIDCDYTERSRAVYYAFLEEVRREAADRGLSLSTTIRLHQLQMPVPPADYGVLMLYNTGDPRRFDERNPVLDLRDVRPYVRYLADYRLPLAAAYPVFRWVRQVQGVRIEHTVEADEILAVKALVEQKRPDLAHSIVIYHLDKENINRYSKETYEAIFHH